MWYSIINLLSRKTLIQQRVWGSGFVLKLHHIFCSHWMIFVCGLQTAPTPFLTTFRNVNKLLPLPSLLLVLQVRVDRKTPWPPPPSPTSLPLPSIIRLQEPSWAAGLFIDLKGLRDKVFGRAVGIKHHIGDTERERGRDWQDTFPNWRDRKKKCPDWAFILEGQKG